MTLYNDLDQLEQHIEHLTGDSPTGTRNFQTAYLNRRQVLPHLNHDQEYWDHRDKSSL